MQKRHLIIILVSLFIGGGAFLSGCAGPPYSETDMQKHFSEANQPLSKFVPQGANKLHYVVQNKAGISAPWVVFIHGTPGQWEAFSEYLADSDLMSRYNMIAVDRLGFGQSSAEVETDLAKQAGAITAALKQEAGNAKTIVVGHSLGGPIALQMAVNHPNQISRLIVLAGAADPALERILWYQHVARWPGVSWVVPEALAKANEEVFPLPQTLIPLADSLDEITAPVTIIHGEDDELVPVGNVDFMVNKLPNAELKVHRLLDQGHFIPWEQYALVKSSILD